MKYIITGASGFIGSHVVEAFLEQDLSVTALVHYNSKGSWGHLEHSEYRQSNLLNVVLGDVTDFHLIRSLVSPGDVILHLAALIGIPYSYHAPSSYINTNIVGTHNILEAARQANAYRVIVTSTSEVYGTAIYTPIDEEHPLQAQSPYSATKIAADKLAESYFKSFGMPVVTLRPFNTYGPRQSARAVIPTILSQLIAGQKEIRLGNLDPKRDLTFVEDTARAFFLAAQTPGIEGETIHFGQGEAVSIGELAQICIENFGAQAKIKTDQKRIRPEKSEVDILLCNPHKAHQVLGWQPQVKMIDGLRKTAEFLKTHSDEYKPKEYSI